MKRSTIQALLSAIACIALAANLAHATALSAARDTPERSGEYVSLTVKDAEIIYAGSIVSIDSNGEAVSATDTSGDLVVGRAEETVDNTDDGEVIKVKRGIFRWANGNTLTAANIGDLAYVEDDATVTDASDASNDVVAGIIIDVDSSGVWVDTYAIGGQGAAAVSTLTASGAVSFSSTLALTGAATFSSTLDVDSITVDAGAGVDNQAAGALLLGAATATSVEIADAGVTTDVQGTLDVDQGLILAYVNKTAAYTNTATDCVISYNTAAGTTHTLPEASTVLGQLFVVALQDDDGDLTVNTDGTDTFDGTNDQIVFADAGDSLVVMATAANVYTILVNVGGTLATQ